MIWFRINAAIIDPEQLCKEHLNLLLSYVKPSKHVSKDTIFRWIMQVLEAAGIDVKKYSAHSRKAAFTSKARGLNFKPRLWKVQDGLIRALSPDFMINLLTPLK